MHALVLALVLSLATQAAGDGADPAVFVRHAVAAVEGDSVTVAEARWRRRLERDAADRLAALGLATLAQRTYRDSIAHRLHGLVMAGGPTDRVGGWATLGLARMAASRAQWAEADSVVRIAVEVGRATGDASLLGEALILLAEARLESVGAAAALETLAEAESVLPDSDSAGRALARCTGARALARHGDPQAGMRAALEGAELAESSTGIGSRAACEFGLAVSHARLFAIDSSLAAYGRAIDAFRRGQDRGALAHVLWLRADILRIIGQFGAARRDAVEAVHEAEAIGRWSTAAWARWTLAQIAIAFEDSGAANREVAEVTRLFAAQDDPRGRVVAASLEADLAFMRGDATAARASLERVVGQARAIGWSDAELGAWPRLVWAGLLAGDSTSAYSALDTARSRLSEAPATGHHGVGLTSIEGTLALRWGSLADAERIFRTRMSAAQGRTRYVDAVRLAEALVGLGRLDEAEREMVTAAEEFDAWRRSLDDRRLRLLAFQGPGDPADPDLGAAIVVAALAAAGRVASAFEVAERGRARELADRLSRAASLDTVSGGRVVRSGPVIDLPRLMQALPDDSTAIFQYVTGIGDPTTLFLITRRKAHAYVLAGHDSIAAPVGRFGALIESGADPRPLGRELASALLEPGLAELEPTIRRLIVVPDGPLHRLPFDALVLPDGRFAVERFALASSPSATVAARLAERGHDAPPAGLLVLADPQFAGERPASAAGGDVMRSAFAGHGTLPRLPATSREARAIARYAADATVRRRGAASAAWLREAPLAAYGVVHFATHALVDEVNASGTALALAPGDGADGFVRPAELAALELAAELVVLSACRTVGGVLVRGEGIQGLAAPLLEAGARAVAATWWPIGDRATVRLMDDFYRSMAEGQPVADALRTAKLAALARGAPASEWAAFTVVGDPLALPRLQPPPARPVTAPRIVLALALALAAGILSWRRRRAGAPPPSGGLAISSR